MREELLKYYLESSKPYLEQMKTLDNAELIREREELIPYSSAIASMFFKDSYTGG